MSLSIYSKASTDSLLALKANLSGATFTGAVTAPGLTITSGSGGVLRFADGTTQSTAATGGGGGATWGSITGSISAQTDLQTEFGNYLALAGGTLTGGLTVASAGITFSDSSIQTTAAVAFTGGSITSSIYWNDGTVSTSMNDGYFLVQDSASSAYGVLYQNGLEVGDGTNTLKIHGNGITFADSTVQTTAFPANTFLPLSGGAMTGALQLGGDLNCDGYNLSSGNFSSPAGQVNCQNLTLTNGDGGSVTFADGSVQTTAASGGLTSNQILANAIASCFQVNQSGFSPVINLVNFAGNICWTQGWFQSGSQYLVGYQSGSLIAPTYFSASLDSSGSRIAQTSDLTIITSGNYLFFSSDGGSTWTQSTFPIN